MNFAPDDTLTSTITYPQDRTGKSWYHASVTPDAWALNQRPYGRQKDGNTEYPYANAVWMAQRPALFLFRQRSKVISGI